MAGPTEKLKDAELDKIIAEQEALLANLSDLEKGHTGGGGASWSSRIYRSLQRNKAGAAAVMMSGSCALMALSMLANKKSYQNKAQELDVVVEAAERERDRAIGEAEVATTRLVALQEGVLRELQNGSWGLTQRLEKLLQESSHMAQGQRGGSPNSEQPSAPKVMPKMI